MYSITSSRELLYMLVNHIMKNPIALVINVTNKTTNAEKILYLKSRSLLKCFFFS